MLTVLPIQSKETQNELCKLCGITYNQEAFAYRADDDGFIGICQFKFSNNNGYISALTYAPGIKDWEAMIIMLRAAMNFMYRCGIQLCFFEENSVCDELLAKSGFLKNENGQYYIDLVKFYTGSCHH
jgi:hypothetical protein